MLAHMTRVTTEAASDRSPPPSATSFPVNTLALVAGLTALLTLAREPGGAADSAKTWQYIPYLPLLPACAVFAVIAAIEWWMRRGRGVPAPASAPRRPLSMRRVALRLWGLVTTLALAALCYWLFPEYAGPFYRPYWRFLETLAPLLVLAPVYLVWVDRRVQSGDAELLEFGRLMSGGGGQDIDWAIIRRHLLGWTVKAFFLPLMTVYLNQEFDFFGGLVRTQGSHALSHYDAWFHLSYAIDLLFCVVGYTVTMRLFDSHMRSVEPTLEGWLVALVCYQPFYALIGGAYFRYEGSVNWETWTSTSPMLRNVLMTAIILLSLTYAFSTVAFGLRFSNLTHRGIITGGPYRFSKHPAYLTKNLSWWLISVPFALNDGWAQAARRCALLLLLNGIYFLRARTEERHLSADPTYVAYAEWINEHGLLAPLGRRWRWLQYRPRRSESSVVSRT
jgi:protein-S-isoprenylcysteine O-methyltransferase Ste14